jgi:hypothetical protein
MPACCLFFYYLEVIRVTTKKRMFPVLLSDDDRQKLDELAREAKRTRGQVIRLLISQAIVSGSFNPTLTR